MSVSLAVDRVLNQAADLISQPGSWTQNWFAKDANGEDVEETSSRATCWCMRGAVFAVAGYLGAQDAFRPILSVIGGTDTSDIEEWNDAPDRTQAEVVAKLREAAAAARGGS